MMNIGVMSILGRKMKIKQSIERICETVSGSYLK